jgi:hypothetical protein
MANEIYLRTQKGGAYFSSSEIEEAFDSLAYYSRMFSKLKCCANCRHFVYMIETVDYEYGARDWCSHLNNVLSDDHDSGDLEVAPHDVCNHWIYHGRK